MFKRDILFHLERWKDDTHRKPLILREQGKSVKQR